MKTEQWAVAMTPWVKALAAKPDDLSSLAGVHIIEGDLLLKVAL